MGGVTAILSTCPLHTNRVHICQGLLLKIPALRTLSPLFLVDLGFVDILRVITFPDSLSYTPSIDFRVYFIFILSMFFSE